VPGLRPDGELDEEVSMLSRPASSFGGREETGVVEDEEAPEGREGRRGGRVAAEERLVQAERLSPRG
jgi:hypothetical protein